MAGPVQQALFVDPSGGRNLRRPIRLLLVDDHCVILQSLALLFSYMPGVQVVGTVSHGLAAVNQARRTRPDVVLLDVNLPDCEGPEVVRMLRHAAPRTGIVAFSAYQDRDRVQAMVHAGASGYVVKNGDYAHIMEAIRSVMQGRSFFSPSVSNHAIGIPTTKAATVVSGDALAAARLTGAEQRVLRMIADGLSNKETAGTLNISVRTVEKHRESIRRKLGLNSAVQLARYAWRRGWTTWDSEQP